MKKYNIYLLILILTVIFIAFGIKDRVTINVGHSLSRGLYWLTEVKDSNLIKKGDIVYFDIPEKAKTYIYGRGYLKNDIKQLLKKVAATEEDQISRSYDKFYINNKFHSNFLKADSLGRPLPQLSTEELQPHEGDLFVVGTHYRSFDSRHYGSIRRSQVKATAKLLFQF